MFVAPPKNPNNMFWHCAFQTPPLQVSKIFFLLANSGPRYGCLGRHPRTQTIVFGILHFRHHHARYPEVVLLVNTVPRYGCLGRHPITQTIFFLLSAVHPRYPTTPLLAYGVLRYGCLVRRPRTQRLFFWHSLVLTPPSEASNDTFAGL